jgi:hypothetical protein
LKKDSFLWSVYLVVSVAAWSTPHAQTPDLQESHPDLTEIIASWQHHPTGPELPVSELTLDPNRKPRGHVSRSDAAQDVDRFFHLLQNGYCGYGYFSRDNDFDAARADILKDLQSRQTWPTREFAALVRKHLDFVKDAHLKLGDVRFAAHQDFWFVPDLDVTQHGERYYVGDSDNGQAIVSVNGRSPEEFSFPSLDRSGRPTYALGMLASHEPAPLQVVVEADGMASGRRYALTRSVYHRSDLFRRFRLGGIPVVRIGTFSDHDVEEVEGFRDSADELRHEACVIVDLRGNGGGNTRWPKEWIRRFTGQTPELAQVLTELVSRTALVGQSNYMAWLEAGPGRGIRDQLERERRWLAGRIEHFDASGAQPFWQAPHIPERPPIRNAVTLVVVIDAAVASAGEGLISYLHDQVDNVVLVGENTCGALTFGHLSAHRLPSSGLMVFLPVKLNLPLDMRMREEHGFDPDYWVPARDALNRAVAAIRAGTIATVKPLPQAVLATEFVPESPPRFSRAQVRRVVQIAAVILFGVVFVVFNRRRGPAPFVVSATVLVVAGAIGFADNPPARWMALLIGAVHGSVAGYKSWRLQRARAKSD